MVLNVLKQKGVLTSLIPASTGLLANYFKKDVKTPFYSIKFINHALKRHGYVLESIKSMQLNRLNIDWIELRSTNGFQKFASVLDSLNIKHGEMLEVSEENLENIFAEIIN